MTKDEALRLALEALEKLWNIIDDIDTYSDMAKADEKLYRSLVERRQRQRFEETGISTDGYELHGGAITAIKAALEAKDEPQYVAFMDTPPRTWVGLTDEEMEAAIPFGNLSGEYSFDDILNIILLIQAKLRSKND
jgi:hypothetical protein